MLGSGSKLRRANVASGDSSTKSHDIKIDVSSKLDAFYGEPTIEALEAVNQSLRAYQSYWIASQSGRKTQIDNTTVPSLPKKLPRARMRLVQQMRVNRPQGAYFIDDVSMLGIGQWKTAGMENGDDTEVFAFSVSLRFKQVYLNQEPYPVVSLLTIKRDKDGSYSDHRRFYSQDGSMWGFPEVSLRTALKDMVENYAKQPFGWSFLEFYNSAYSNRDMTERPEALPDNTDWEATQSLQSTPDAEPRFQDSWSMQEDEFVNHISIDLCCLHLINLLLV